MKIVSAAHLASLELHAGPFSRLEGVEEERFSIR